MGIVDEVNLEELLAKASRTSPADIVDIEPISETSHDEIERVLQGEKPTAKLNDSKLEPGVVKTFEDVELDPPTSSPGDTPSPADVLVEAEEFADALVELFDVGGKMLYPKLYLNGLDKTDLAALKTLANKVKTRGKDKGELTYTVEDQRIMGVYNDYEEYVKEIPLSDSEKNKLRKPLKLVLKTANFKMSPEGALIAAACTVSLPRVAPLAANSKLLKRFMK